MGEEYLKHLFVKIDKPEGEGKFPLVIGFHGLLSSHQELGEQLPQALKQEGFGVLLFDFRGHGRSQGKGGKISLVSLFEDSQLIINRAKGLDWVDKNLIFGLGHSLGTIAVLQQQKDFAGLILLAPPAYLKNNLNFLEKIFYPFIYYLLSVPYDYLLHLISSSFSFSLPYKYKKKDLFKSQEAAKKATFALQKFIPASNYPLIRDHDSLSLAQEVKKPTLILVGRYDKITGVKGANLLYQRIRAEDKKLVILENSGHSLLLDQEGEAAAKEIIGWLKEKVNFPKR